MDIERENRPRATSPAVVLVVLAGVFGAALAQNDGGFKIVKPSGGEVYRIGDTVRVSLSSTIMHKAVLSLIVDIYTFNVSAPFYLYANTPKDTFFVIPPSYNAAAYDTVTGLIVPEPVSTVYPACKLKLWDYNRPTTYATSDSTFAIEPGAGVRNGVMARHSWRFTIKRCAWYFVIGADRAVPSLPGAEARRGFFSASGRRVDSGADHGGRCATGFYATSCF